MNVLVIPEDFRKDQFILQPIISAMLTKLGRPAIVEVLKDPLVGGIQQALNLELLSEIVDSNRWRVDLFLLCVDRDAEASRRDRLSTIEQHFKSTLGPGKIMACENAWQELEVWVLAGHDLLDGWRWADIRQHRDPKEAYFEELVRVARIPEPKKIARQIVMLHEGAIAFAQVLGHQGVADNAKQAAERLIAA